MDDQRTGVGCLVIAAVLAGCASSVNTGPTGDSGPAGACTNWVLTDEEQFVQGELFTDRHLVFDAAGQLQLVREHYRSGGHGYMQDYRETAFTWTPTGLVGVTTGDWLARSDSVHEGADLVERTVATEVMGQTYTRSVRFVRDAAGRVTARVQMPANSGEDDCRFRYDAAGRLQETGCELTRYLYQWDGERLARRERLEGSGARRSVSAWRWDADGRVAQSSTGYDSGQGLRTTQRFFQYNAAGALSSVEEQRADEANRRVIASFEYDANGRLAREVSGEGVRAWERDEQGRPVRVTSAGIEQRFTYEDAPNEVRVTETTGPVGGAGAGASRRTWRYVCFASPPRLEPAEPALDYGVQEPRAQVGHYPVADRE